MDWLAATTFGQAYPAVPRRNVADCAVGLPHELVLLRPRRARHRVLSNGPLRAGSTIGSHPGKMLTSPSREASPLLESRGFGLVGRETGEAATKLWTLDSFRGLGGESLKSQDHGSSFPPTALKTFHAPESGYPFRRLDLGSHSSELDGA